MAKKSATTGSKQRPAGKSQKKGGKKRKENIWIKLGRKLFGKKAEEVSDRYVVANPMYAYDIEKGKDVVRPLPDGLTAHEADILRKVRKNAYNLDYKCFGCCNACTCCGLTVGRTTVIGIIPALGPILDVGLGVSRVNLKARKVDLPWGVAIMMYVRHGISEGIGLAPFVGDVWIAWYKVIWTNTLPEKLNTYLGNTTLATQAYGAPLTFILSYPVGTSERSQMVHAYNDAQRLLCIAGVCLCAPFLVCALSLRNPRLVDRQSLEDAEAEYINQKCLEG